MSPDGSVSNAYITKDAKIPLFFGVWPCKNGGKEKEVGCVRGRSCMHGRSKRQTEERRLEC